MTAYVYFIGPTTDGAPVKIGLTRSDPTSRLAALQTGSPAPLAIRRKLTCTTVQQAQRLELRLHKRFAEYRLHGEWFRCEDPVREFIDDPAPIATKCPLCSLWRDIEWSPTDLETCSCDYRKRCTQCGKGAAHGRRLAPWFVQTSMCVTCLQVTEASTATAPKVRSMAKAALSKLGEPTISGTERDDMHRAERKFAIRQYAAEIVAEAPPLTETQIRQLQVLLQPRPEPTGPTSA